MAALCHRRGFSRSAVGVDSGALDDRVGNHGQDLGEGHVPGFDVALGRGLALEDPSSWCVVQQA